MKIPTVRTTAIDSRSLKTFPERQGWVPVYIFSMRKET